MQQSTHCFYAEAMQTINGQKKQNYRIIIILKQYIYT